MMSGSCWPEWSMGETDPLPSLYQTGMLTVINNGIQRWAVRWALGCMNSAYWLPLAVKREFTQPRAHLIAQLCIAKFH